MGNHILFGLGPSGLFLGREIAKNGEKVFGIGRKDDIGIYSKYIEGTIAETKKDIVKAIDEIVKKSTRRPKAHICSDQYLTLLLNEWPQVFDLLDFVGVKKNTLELINNKNQINAYCKKINILTPKTYSFSEIIEGGKKDFPIILKHNSKKLQEIVNPIGKTKVLKNLHDLEELNLKITQSNFSINSIIAQEFIPGDNSNQYSFGGYFQEGKERAGIVVNQLRQYPQGVSSFVIETKDLDIEKKIKKLVYSFVAPMKYTGFLELEFKINNEKIYLMDINPRPWGWISILEKKYNNFHSIFLNEKNTVLNRTSDYVKWKSPIRDIAGHLKNPLNAKSVSKYKRAKVKRLNTAYDIYNKNDLKPSIVIFKVAVNKMQKRKR